MSYRQLLEASEPTTEPTTRYDVNTHTPWGPAQMATYYGDGIVLYSTAGHGGFHVSRELLKRIPYYLQTADRYADGTQGWFEEDCGCVIVVICFPERFRVEFRESAIEVMQNFYPEQWKRFCQESN